MKDRTVKQLHSVIHRLVKKWKYALYLGMWKIDFVVRDYIGDSRVDGYQTAASCDTSWQYFTAAIDFSYVQLKDMEEEEIEKIIIHELLHIVVNEMREDGIEHEERVVSHLSMVISYLDK